MKLGTSEEINGIATGVFTLKINQTEPKLTPSPLLCGQLGRITKIFPDGKSALAVCTADPTKTVFLAHKTSRGASYGEDGTAQLRSFHVEYDLSGPNVIDVVIKMDLKDGEKPRATRWAPAKKDGIPTKPLIITPTVESHPNRARHSPPSDADPKLQKEMQKAPIGFVLVEDLDEHRRFYNLPNRLPSDQYLGELFRFFSWKKRRGSDPEKLEIKDPRTTGGKIVFLKKQSAKPAADLAIAA